jgi:hypothetical protein
MSFFIGFISVVAVVLVILASPSAASERSWKRFFINLPLCFFGIMLPLFVFLMSVFLTPEWKGGCHNGWIDCFYEGKLALTPLVLWATAALYKVEVSKRPDRSWIAYGLLTGAIVSSVCLLFGFVTNGPDHSMEMWLAVPFYTALWYVFRAAQSAANGKIKFSGVLKTLTGSAPFWGASAAWTYHAYFSLPTDPPGCFIVTAASRGHRNFVGPFLEVPHRGKTRLVNQQLATLWQLEALWRGRAQRSHAVFRRGYNVVGPIIARRITAPLIADALYVALKPAEFFGRLLVNSSIHPSK